MARRSLYEIIFGKPKEKTIGTDLKLLNSYTPIFTNFNGNIYQTSQIRSCIDTIARNGAKMSPKHIRSTTREYRNLNDNIIKILAEKPNELDNAYSFYYKVISQLYLNNNAFIFIQRDAVGNVTGLYPLLANQYKLLEYKGEIYVKFQFNNGSMYTAPLKDDVIHLKRFYCEDDVCGGGNAPIVKLMSYKHIIQEGIVNAIKTTQSIRGILKTTKAMLKPEDIKATRDRFVNDFISGNDGSGIGGLDSTTDFVPVNISPTTATEGQIKLFDDEILEYFGLNKNILQSKYTEEEWNAFNESVLVPIALQIGLEFTNKLFTITERFHGNRIVFESNRLAYASTSTKISLLKEVGALGLITINEGRAILNLEPVEDGDVRLQSLNYTEVGKDNKEENENE